MNDSANDAAKQRYAVSLMNTFGPPKLVLARGEGAYVWDVDGNRYLDLLGGIAVNALGHAHPALVGAVTDQLRTLGHVSNFFATEPQIRLAERLLELVPTTDGGKVFFANSGTEANEAAFKLTRRTGRTHLVAMEGSFHGRSLGALALTAKAAYREPFEPLPGHVEFVPYGDADALAAAVTDETAAVVVEPIQGEAGVVIPPAEFLPAARRICTEHGALLWLDEVQTGMGRTGAWLAHSASGVAPDVVTLAKGLAGGIPIGACIATGSAADLLQPGNHGTTFGGNPVAAAAALAVIDTIEKEDLLTHAVDVGRRLESGLAHPRVTEVRAAGLLIGIDLDAGVAANVVSEAQQRGFIVNMCAPHRIRLAPPLVLTAEQADEFAAAWPDILHAAYAAHPTEQGSSSMTRHFLRDDDLGPAEQAEVLSLAATLKKNRFAAAHRDRPLEGPRAVALLFDKPTLRTQVSFTTGIAELGGFPLLVDGTLAKVGERESIADTARVLGRQVTAIVWRTFDQGRIEEMARFAGVPVVNALTDQFHPCQLLADLQTIAEHRGGVGALPGLTVAFLGDAASNMSHSYLLAGATAGMHVRVSGPSDYQPDPEILSRAVQVAEVTGASARYLTDAAQAVRDADVVVTDTWVSMGKETEAAERAETFRPYAVTDDLLAGAAADAIVLHCLPAYRGKEITAEVIDGPRSVVWDEAENRLHAQKALLSWLLAHQDGAP